MILLDTIELAKVGGTMEFNYYFDSFPKINYGIMNYSIGIANGNKHYHYNVKEKEIYDLASITKLFTLNIIYNLEKQNLIQYNNYLADYIDLPNLKNVTIIDIIKMRGILRVDRKLSDTKTYEEFQETLRSVHIVDEESTEYNDIGFCLLGNLIEKVTGISLEENFNNLFDTLDLQSTKVLPNHNYTILGNGNSLYLPNDLKTRINNGITGAAGVFSNVIDLEKYARKIMNYEIFDKSFIDNIFHYNFIDKANRNRTYAGLYKYTDHYRSYVGKTYSIHTLAHQGYTGAVLLMDFESKIINILLFDAIEKDSKLKKDNFFDGYYLLQNKVENLSREI